MYKEEAKAVLKANLKGPKIKLSSLLVVAEATRLLVNDKEYGSTRKVAEAFGVRRQTIEPFYKMNEQPEEIKKLIQEGKVGIDTSMKLSSISDVEKRISAAKSVAGLSADNARRIISHCKSYPKLSPEDCKIAIMNSKPVKKQVKSLTIHLEPENYERLMAASKKAGLDPEAAAKRSIFEWISKQKAS